MKLFWKIFGAIVAAAAVVFVAVAYGDKIVAWVKKLLNSLGCCCGDDCCCGDACCCEENAVQADEADFEG